MLCGQWASQKWGAPRVLHTRLHNTMETTLNLCADLQGIPAGDGSKTQLKTVNDSLTKQVRWYATNGVGEFRKLLLLQPFPSADGGYLYTQNIDQEISRQMRFPCCLQGEALQEVARTFSQTAGRDGDGVAAANSPLIAAAMEHTKLASLGSVHLL